MAGYISALLKEVNQPSRAGGPLAGGSLIPAVNRAAPCPQQLEEWLCHLFIHKPIPTPKCAGKSLTVRYPYLLSTQVFFEQRYYSTICKWRSRDTSEDRSHTPHRLQSTLNSAQKQLLSPCISPCCRMTCWQWDVSFSTKRPIRRQVPDWATA